MRNTFTRRHFMKMTAAAAAAATWPPAGAKRRSIGTDDRARPFQGDLGIAGGQL